MDIREPLVELRSTRLYQRLVELDAAYAQRAITFLEAITPMLASTAKHFPYYTRHDAHHGFRVLRRVEQVIALGCLDDTQPQSFTAAEIYLIILAAYAHDLGMTVFPGEADQLLKALGLTEGPDWETNPRLQSFLRREHSKRGGSYIQENAARLQVPINLVDALDKIMRAHNLSIGELEATIAPSYAAEEKPIDVRQLAIIMCVADALEFSETRVVDGVLAAIATDPSLEARISYLENMKHICVGDSLAVDTDGRVIVSGTFSEEEVLALAHLTFDQMEAWIRGYCDLERRLSTPRLRIRPEPFIRNLAFPNGRFERLGVRLNKRSVIDLISSNAIWRESGGLAIRELLQNAVEACRYRRHHSSQADVYEPRVSVTFDRKHREIVVVDNGCGMTERVILNNLLTVGSSRSAEPGYTSAGYAPIARFGVGFWSVFTLAQIAHVETASFEPYRGDPKAAEAAVGTAFDVSLDHLKEYTVFRPITRPCGTTVRIQLREDIIIDDVFTGARAQILCSEIPVTFRTDDEEIAIPNVVPDVPDEAVLGSRGKIIDEHGIRLFPWRDSKGKTDLSLLIAYRIVNGKPTFLLNDRQSLMNALPGLRHSRTSICGFGAPLRTTHLCFDLDRVGAYLANRTTPDGIAFSLDRRQLIENSTSAEFAKDVTNLVHDGYRAFLQHTNGQDLGTIAELRRQAAMHGGNVYDSFTKDELFEAVRRFPDLAPFKLYPLRGGDPIHVRADELQTLTGIVCFTQQHLYAQTPNGMVMHETEGEPGARLVQKIMTNAVGISFVMEQDRSASWLFDADPDSTVTFAQVKPFGPLAIQVVQLERVDVSRPAQVLVEVQGRWTGAIYLRDFVTPKSKPYVFLGRYRVLIKRSSTLAAHFQGLVEAGRHSKLADLVADLQEDEAGYTPASVAAFLT
ncbi:ATP-binding protein [Mesorhizobium sp. AR02]|uniref:HD domain-containing protein n=1 Tax=Mesorhizobium sp. AR02 TaxID=2865837 RepID=UPI00215F76F8|nr:ATP-binding protein [Mesorhizobium sp. AR02]UVK55839.1 ATP-binding protein [Mesorhizobium sp. AR02]